MTPVEFRHAVRGAELRWQDERERDLIQAWRALQLYVEVTNTKKLPGLMTVLARTRQKATTTGLDLTDLAMLSERIGIPLRNASPEALDALRRMRES
jgi:hypothetical protein